MCVWLADLQLENYDSIAVFLFLVRTPCCVDFKRVNMMFDVSIVDVSACGVVYHCSLRRLK